MRTIGLTGGIACGKSTVGRLLAARGIPVLDLDQVARDVVAPGSPALAAIAERWPAVVRDGQLDRKALGAIIVADRGQRAELEAITHPRIWTRSQDWLERQEGAGAAAAVVEAALMVETGSWRRYDQLLVVSASPPVQLARLCAREHLSTGEAERWLATQMPLADKERVATAVIRNDGDEDALSNEVDRAWAELEAAGHRA